MRSFHDNSRDLCTLIFLLLASASSGSIFSQHIFAGSTSRPLLSVPFSTVTIDNLNPRNPHCKAIGDIDGDGLLDVVVASSTNFMDGVFWYRYPSWTKSRISTGSFSTDMQTGDVDGDGDLDVIVPKGADYGSAVYWYENPRPLQNPATSIWPEHFVGSAGAHDVEVADLNKDGRLDIIVRLVHTTIFFRNSDTTWTPVVVNTMAHEGTSFGDIDNDNDLDIALNGTWLQNPLPGGNPITTPWTARQFTSNWPLYAITHVVDVNKDGKMDILMSPSESSDGKISWFETTNPLTGPWTEHVVLTGVSYVHEVYAADVDNDSDNDIVFAEMHQSANKRVAILLNNGGQVSWTEQILATTGSHNIRIGDFGNDGDIDIVGANWNDGNTYGAPIMMWENRTSNPPLTLDSWSRVVVDPSRPWQSIFVSSGDIDRDGKKDIITGGWWYKNPGVASGTWQRNTIGSPLNNMAAVADFDGNGSMDILGTQGTGANANAQFVWARNDGSGSLTILNNISNGDGDFLQGVEVRRFVQQSGEPTKVALSWHLAGKGIQTLTVPANPSSDNWNWARISTTSQDEQLSASDINNDGYVDLMLGTKWLNNAGGWSPNNVFSPNGDPDRNRMGDINNDGRPDVVVGYEAINILGRLAWYEAPATPTNLWAERVISDSVVGPMSVDLADMDRDGDLDVIVGEHNYANPATAKLIIFENTNGTGSAWAKHIVFTGDEHHDGAHVFDVDNDGDLDIVSIGWTNYQTILYENRAIVAGAGSTPPTITTHPTNQTVTVGQAATFTVNASGTQPLSYQWQKNGTAIGGATSQSYNTPATTLADNGTTYRCIVSNAFGTTVSTTALLTVNSGGGVPPSITSQPASQGATVGQTATFSVTVSGTNPLSFQWTKNGSTIPGATNPTHTTPATIASDNGSTFRCIVMNTYGTATSNGATLSVLPQAVARITSGLQALYTFEEGNGATINDVSGVGSPLNLTVANGSNVSWGQGFLRVNTATIIASGVLATKVIDACKASSEITVEVWMKTASLNQSGPARIVTISADVSNRDFTLGQGVSGGSTNAFEMRRRTSTTSSNGTPALATPAGSITTQLEHVVATRSANGTNKVFINGVEVSSGTTTGNFSSWTYYQLALANELTNDRPWLGEFHLVGIYSRALTQSEINQNYSAGANGTPAVVNAKAILQGAYKTSGDSMTTMLQSAIPLTQPYNVAPWNYSGKEAVATIPTGVVDWVLVELRTGTSAGTTVATRAGFLKSNGIIVDKDGSSPLIFYGITSGNYYIVLRHRNHLAVMSANSVGISSLSGLFDFSATQANAFGTQPLVQLNSNVFGMCAGDANSSGLLNSTDVASVLGTLNVIGYTLNDLNFSSIVTAADLNIVFGNLNKASQVP